ncbi:MAG: porin family protein [Bacteroidales bacterium]|nr:porin family protein [Bacteroidales bacterium]MDD4208782.1 porin family protein [Bacteroidales bacterium]
MKRIIVLFIVIFFGGAHTSLLHAQRRPQKAPNLVYYDKKKFHFGFMLGYNMANFAIKPKTNLNEFDSLMIIETTPMSGFNIGIVSDLHLGKHFNLRFIPEISLLDRIVTYNIRYDNQNIYKVNKKIESVSLDFPLLLKFKSIRMQNVRFYVIGGAQYSLDLASQAKKQSQNSNITQLKLLRHDLQTQVGAGIDMYMNMFKFAIEFKMSYGMLNLLKNEDNLYTNSIDHLNSKIFHLSFLFE